MEKTGNPNAPMAPPPYGMAVNPPAYAPGPYPAGPTPYPSGPGPYGSTPGPVPNQPQVIHVVSGDLLGPDPVTLTCPMCHASIQTSTQSEPGIITWISCGVMAFFGLFLCCLLPFCIGPCLDVHHKCPNCKGKIGVYRRL